MPATKGALNTICDVPGVLVGSAHDSEARTGVTVIRTPGRAVASVAVGGGGPGTRETDALTADTLVDALDAVVFSGGSVYGLAAADGVAAALGAAGHGYGHRVGSGIPVSPIVPSAILYDLANGGNKAWGTEPPYRALGMKALSACADRFDLGACGAGFGAMAGQQRGGVGSASIVTPDGIVVGALAAVNSYGAVRMPGSDAFWAWPYEQDREFGGQRPPVGYSLDLDDWGAAKANPGAGAGRTNTTLGCVATNVQLTVAECRRVALMAQAGLARAIRPVFAPFDGDVVFALSTSAMVVDAPRSMLVARLGELAAGCLARAVARGVYEAR